MTRALVVIASLVASSCAFSPPEGALRCDVDTPCPPDFVCRSTHTCWRTPDTVDAGADAATSIDAHVADSGRDAIASDAASLDTGIDASTFDVGVDAGTDAPSSPDTGIVSIDAAFSDAACVSPCNLNDALEVTAGFSHTCVLMGNGTVQCFGDNRQGQLGNGTSVGQHATPTPLANPPVSPFVHVDAESSQTTCATTADHHAWCWGWRYAGSTGDGSLGDATTGDPVPNPTTVLTLSDVAHTAGSCAWNAAGEVYAWGSAPGTGSPTAQAMPTAPIGGAHPMLVQYVSHGADLACALTASAPTLARCWGFNQSGAVDPTMTAGVQILTPTAGVPATLVSAMDDHVCIVRGAQVLCWGNNAVGQCGAAPSPMVAPTVVHVASTGDPLDGTQVLAIGGTAYSSCAVMADHGVLCWGGNAQGYGGWGITPAQDSQARPVTVGGATLGGVTQITNGGQGHACVLRDDGRVLCWGDNTWGQLATPAIALTVSYEAYDTDFFPAS